MAIENIDLPKLIETLKEKLDDLTGFDFEDVERQERLAGNTAPNVSFTPSFRTRLAAKALGVNPHDIKELKLKQYTKIDLEVMTFLFGGSEKDETSSSTYEAQLPTLKSGEA